jgi:PKD repeat protein
VRGFLAVATRLLAILLVLGLCVVLPVNGQDASVPPVADFTYSPTLPYMYEQVLFNASASYDPNGFIYSYTWDFGDGNVTVVSDPEITHVYLNPGEYNVTLLVTDSCLLTNSTSKPLHIRTHVSASFSYSPHDPHVDEVVTFDASNSTATDGVITTYAWSFGDGNESVVDTPFISHSYVEANAYTVTLNVTSSSGEWDVTSEVVNVTLLPKVAPIAVFTWFPGFPEAGQTVEFNASDSTPDGGSIIGYEWDFGDGTIQPVTQPITTHVFQSFGNYTVVLNVTDSDGFSGVTNRSVTVVERPFADFFFNPTEPRVCNLVTFNASISNPRGGYIVSFEWIFGNDSTVQSGVEVTHRFRRMGENLVSLNLTDSEGMWDAKNVTIKILPHIADLNEDGVVDILDIAIFAKAFGSFPGHSRWNPRADLNGNNIINILDGAVIARSYNMCIDPFDC